ncbi:MAG: nitroreductase [Actinomycetes bacterium]
MNIDEAIRTRRTHKTYGPTPVPRETLEELFELARWAPNHFVTEPWRFRVLGTETVVRLAAAGEPNELEKLKRAPTLVVATAKLSGDLFMDADDRQAAACAVYIVLLAAHARGIGTYWRTPKLLRTEAGRAAVGIEPDEELVGLIHLGSPTGEPKAKPRSPVDEFVSFLP